MTDISKTVYFDNAATTPLLPEVADTLDQMNRKVYGNSASAHILGQQAAKELEAASATVARAFDVPASHVVFTSGGTESNNLAIWGSLGGFPQAITWITSGQAAGSKVLTTQVEHSASAKVFECLQQLGARVGWLEVDGECKIKPESLERETRDRVKLISIHHAQNEIGVVQDLKSIAAQVRERHPDVILHTDAIQSFLKVPFSFENSGFDIVSISGHKIGGPKGVGALILGKRFEKRVPKLGSLILGSAQQSGVRAGTVAVPLIAGLAKAVECGAKNFDAHRETLLKLRTALIEKLPKRAVLNGPKSTAANGLDRVPQTLNFSIPGLPSAVTVEALSTAGFCVSAGSACHATNTKPNETLMRMGIGLDRATSSVRVSFGASNTLDEVSRFTSALDFVVEEFG